MFSILGMLVCNFERSSQAQTTALRQAICEIRSLPKVSKNKNDYEIYAIELDQATSFTADLATQIFAELDIHPRFTSREHNQNGLAEVVIRELYRRARVLMYHAVYHPDWELSEERLMENWPWAIRHAAFLMNLEIREYVPKNGTKGRSLEDSIEYLLG